MGHVECYEEVRTGREIGSVREKVADFGRFPMGNIGGTEMWKVGEKVRAAMKVSQCDLLMEQGHCYSEVANESIIEAVDSLNPYMDFKGISYMVDNCSHTARLGSRKWAPRFDYLLEQEAEPLLQAEPNAALVDAFKSNPIHGILAKCQEYRPSVDIALEL